MARVQTDLARVFVLLAPLLLTPTAAAEPDLYEGKHIVTIQFEPREQPIEAQEIYRILPVKVNSPLKASDVREAIHRLFATGQYTDVQVDAELHDAGVAIRFITRNSWFIGRVASDQSVKEPPNNGQMVNASGLRLGDAYRAETIVTSADSMQQLLKSNGYYESRVEPRFEYEARTQQIHIRFVVDAGKRGYFERPEISGDIKMPLDDVVRFTKWKGWFGWRPVTLSRTQRGIDLIRRKYQQEERLMAKVLLQGMDYEPDTGRVKSRIEIDAGPKVEVRTIGADVSRSRLIRLIPIYEEGTVDRDLLVEGARNLRDYFQSDGYFDAEVEFKESRVVRDRAQIDFLINRGRRQRVLRVEVTGNRYFDTQTIRERMFTMARSFQFRRGRYSESLLRRDVEAIRNLYRENGFRDVEVRTDVDEIVEGKNRGLAITVNIVEGSQWLVSEFKFEGAPSFDPDALLALITSQEGQPYSEYQIAVDRDALLARLYSEGYSEAVFTWSVAADDDNKRVALKYAIQEGPQRFVRQVVTSGLKTTQPGLVNRNLLLNPGDPLSVTRMAETQQRLYDLGIFARVNVAIQNPEGDTANKYVLYQMDEANRYSITGGLGAEVGRIGGDQTSLASPAGSAGFSPRVSLDLSRLNFRGIGHTVSFRSRLSNIQQRGLVNYSAPRLRNVPGQDLSFTFLIENSGDVRTFTSRRREGSVQLSQRLSKANTLLYRYSFRRVGVDNLKIDPLLVPLLSQPVRIGIVSGNLIQDKRDDPTDATRGVYNTVDLGLAAGFFGSEEDYGRILGRNATYHAFGKRLVFARSLTFGWIAPIALDPATKESNTDIPLPERFFSGGANTHRGFPENQAGPRDVGTGFPLGGRAVLMNTLEIRFPILGGNLGGVVFHDAGNVYSRIGNISFRLSQRDLQNFDYMVHAVGFGVRYRTPIGPVRFDLGYSMNSPRFLGCSITNSLTECGPQVEQRISRLQFHFSIGQAF